MQARIRLRYCLTASTINSSLLLTVRFHSLPCLLLMVPSVAVFYYNLCQCPRRVGKFNDEIFNTVCIYVCMSEDLYPARLKQSHRCAAVSNKQKCLQCPFETFSRQVDWAPRGRKAVPNPRSSNSETLIAECTVGTSDDERRTSQYPTIDVCAVSTVSTLYLKRDRLLKIPCTAL